MKLNTETIRSLLIVIAMSVGAVHADNTNQENKPSATDPGYDWRSGDSDEWATRDCLLEPHMIIDLASPVSGVISRIKVDKGDRVKKGNTVVYLRSEVEKALVNLKMAELEFSKITITRNDELYRQNLISPQERDEIALKSELAGLQLATTKARLQQKRINSPISGVVLERLMDPGEYVSDHPILKIASLNPLYVEAVFPRELFGSIKSGMKAEVGLEEPIGGVHNAKVSVVDQVIDAASGTFGVRLLLPNKKNRIPAGLKCKIRFLPAKK